MTTFASPDSSYEIGENDLGLLMLDVELNLRRRADLKIRHALEIGKMLVEGYREPEIRAQLGLTVEQFKRAREWLEWAIRETPRDG